MFSDTRVVLIALLVVFASVFRLEAQGFKTDEQSRFGLGEKLVLPQQSQPSPARERIPLEGKIDRSIYCLGPGDEVDVSVWGMEVYKSYHLFVSAEGRLLVPPAGPMEVDGMTLDQAEAFLVQRMSEYYSGARVSVTLINPRTFRVFAVGALSRPGIYYMSAVDRVSELLGEAGGIRPGGSRRQIRLLNKDRQLLQTVDLMRYLMKGELEENPLLVDGCIAEVPPLENYVILRGSFTNLSGSDSVAVNERKIERTNEFVVEYLPGESLGDILELVGGLEDFEIAGYGRRVALDSPANPQLRTAITEEMIQSPLEARAIYEFPLRNKWVAVSGSVYLPGRYLYQPGWTVRDYLGQAGGPDRFGSEKTCFLRRADGVQFKCKLTDEVLPGDTIFIPEKVRIREWVLTPVVSLLTALIIVVANK